MKLNEIENFEEENQNDNINFQCAKCGNCCRSNIVTLTTGDLRRIKNYLQRNKSLRHLKDKFYVDYNRIKSYESYDNKNYDNEMKEIFENSYFLRQIKSETIANNPKLNEKCIFLTKDNLCLIYKERPNACGMYPFIKISEGNKSYVNSEQENNNPICNGFFIGKQNKNILEEANFYIRRTIREIFGESI